MKKSRDNLKKQLMLQMEETVDRILDWGEDHPTFTLTELEDFLLGLRKEIGISIAEDLIDQLTGKQLISAPVCEDCGQSMVYKGQDSKGVESRLGNVSLKRGRYSCPHCKSGIFPPG